MNKFSGKSGFTLIELLVAAGIFVVVMTIVVGLFSRFMLMQRRSIAENRILEEVRFALELFNRETRTAYGDTYTPSGDGTAFLMRNQNGYCVVYRLAEGRIQRAEQNTGTSICSLEDVSQETFADVTGADINVTQLSFDVTLAQVEGDRLARQGFVTVSLSAQPLTQAIAPLVVRSSVTSRQIQPYVQP